MSQGGFNGVANAFADQSYSAVPDDLDSPSPHVAPRPPASMETAWYGGYNANPDFQSDRADGSQRLDTLAPASLPCNETLRKRSGKAGEISLEDSAAT